MFIGNSQKRARYLSSPVYRCRVWWIQNWLQFEQHSDYVSSISSVKNSPENAIKIYRLFLAVVYEHCVTIKQTVIRAGRQVYHVNPFFEKKIQGIWDFRDTLILTCLCNFYLFLFPVLIKVSVIVSGKLIELASSFKLNSIKAKLKQTTNYRPETHTTR